MEFSNCARFWINSPIFRIFMQNSNIASFTHLYHNYLKSQRIIFFTFLTFGAMCILMEISPEVHHFAYFQALNLRAEKNASTLTGSLTTGWYDMPQAEFSRRSALINSYEQYLSNQRIIPDRKIPFFLHGVKRCYNHSKKPTSAILGQDEIDAFL